MKFKLVLIGLLAGVSFMLGYGASGEAYPGGGVFGRAEWRGYFTNTLDTSGTYVLNAAYSTPYGMESFPTWVDSAEPFIFFVEQQLGGNNQQRTGASFIIQTMIGSSRNRPPNAAEIAEWEARVRAMQNLGRINWSYLDFPYNLNSYFQGTTGGGGTNDDAFYDNSGRSRAIVFANADGTAYVIRRACGNPVGNNNIPNVQDDVNFSISGRSTVSNASPTPGTTITFSHYVKNNGPTSTSPTNVFWIAEKMEPLPQTTITGGNSGIYAAGEEKNVTNHNVTIPLGTPPGTRFCERVGWDPVNSSGARDGRGASACATVPYNFDLTPSVNAVITSGGAPVAGNVAEVGDTISFTYAVNNGGTTESQSITCTYRQQTWPGHNESAPTTVFTPAGANCPPARTFPASSNTTTATEASVTAVTANTTICRSFTVTPVTQSGGTETAQACVLVAAKPYARIWGGDVSAGNGLANSSGVCTNNSDGAIVGWNKRNAGGNAGAGVQFAGYALARITDFATALHDPGGAPSPNGLSFSNIGGNAANGDFGGGFGDVPCIPDYYATRPASTSAIPATVAAMVTGVYGGSGNITLGGGSLVNPNNRITVYVDGNLFINGNITYSGSWNVGSIPLFEMIVRGNIYIDNDVTQLDGVYVAQPTSAGVGGEIHTCATVGNGFAPLPLNTLYANCTRKLTVNGLFTAKQVRLLRTIGSLSQSNASEPSTSGSIAETFNYGPAVWVQQPVRQNQGATTPDYDAIVSLPPIL